MADRQTNASRARHHPITWHQENLCDKMIAQVPSLSAWKTLTLGFAAHITPAVDIRLFERAFRRLQMRHDVLRMNFVDVGGRWRAVIHPDPRAKVVVEDLGPQDAQARRVEIDRRFGAGFAVNEPPVSLHILRFGDEGDVMLLQVSHLVTDGFGSSLIIKDFISLLIRLPLLAPSLPYEAFTRAYIQRPKSELEAGLAYWSGLISASAPTPIGLAKTGSAAIDRYATNRNYAQASTSLSAQATNQVETRARDIGCTPFVLLASGFFEVIRSTCGAESLDFGTLLGRGDARLEHWAGLAVTNLPAVCRARDGPDLPTRAKVLHDQIRTSMQHLPHPAVQPGHAVMQAYIANGGTPGRFRIRSPEFKPRELKSSIFSADLSNDKPVRIGKYQMIVLPVGAVSALSELTFSLSSTKDRMRVSVVYDIEGYSKGEVCKMLDLTAAAMLGED